MVVRVRQEGERWCPQVPDPPLETLDQARARAINVALMATPR
jgi:hypothetical protein